MQRVLDVVDQAVVLGVEDLVDRAQRDVLVAATVTADEVQRRAARRRRCRRRRRVGEAVCRRRVGVRASGVTGLPGRVVGTALCAMSFRNAVSMRSALRRHRDGRGRRGCPRRRPAAVRTAAGPFGPGMKLPYGSAAIIGMLSTSVSTSCRPSMVAACSLISAQVAMPLRRRRRLTGTCRSRPAGRRCCYVLAQEDLVRRVRGVGLALVDERRVGVRARCADAVGAGRTIFAGLVVPRVSTMNRSPRQLVAVAGDVVRAAATSGSSSFSGTKTVPLPPLVILSRPWSKNWPKIVNSELNGGDRPTSVVTFGMNSVSSGPRSRASWRRRRSWS